MRPLQLVSENKENKLITISWHSRILTLHVLFWEHKAAALNATGELNITHIMTLALLIKFDFFF